MSNRFLKKYIKSFQNQKTEVYPILLRVFKRLITYYADKLESTDSLQELNLFFVELLFSINTENFKLDSSNSLARYISVAIRNKYIELSKAESKYNFHHRTFGETFFVYENDFELQFEIAEILKILSDNQRRVIICKYFYNYSDNEISELMGISRQAVNGLKNRALKILRQLYLEQ